MSDSAAPEPFVFENDGNRLVGFLHRGTEKAERGVLILTGGQQYRVGNHRQFLHLARRLADAGIPTMRFDFRGSGDADGVPLDFGLSESYAIVGRDLGAAIDEFRRQMPEMKEVVLWGLCSAGTAIMANAANYHCVSGIVVLNPWIRSRQSEARTMLRHYYAQKLFSRDLWSRLMKGEIEILVSIRGLFQSIARSFGVKRKPAQTTERSAAGESLSDSYEQGLLDLVMDGLRRYEDRGLLVLSDADLTAAEFEDASRAHRDWPQLMDEARWCHRKIEGADHTFSSELWRKEVADETIGWLKSW